jgi:putative radical SAM enzyme (TIGR03279 family)
VKSVAVVPSGLTAHREGLYPLQPFEKDDCEEVLSLIDKIGEENLEKFGTRLCYASDEWYITAGKEIPGEEYYEEYPQIENGVGMIRSMDTEIDEEIENLSDEGFELSSARNISVVTGEAAYDFIKKSVEKLSEKWYNLNCNVYMAKNYFFGGAVTVAGLLTGSDLVRALEGKELGDILYIPSVMLRHEGDKFLDDMTVSELSEKLSVSVCTVTSDGADFVDTLLGI